MICCSTDFPVISLLDVGSRDKQQSYQKIHAQELRSYVQNGVLARRDANLLVFSFETCKYDFEIIISSLITHAQKSYLFWHAKRPI